MDLNGPNEIEFPWNALQKPWFQTGVFHRKGPALRAATETAAAAEAAEPAPAAPAAPTTPEKFVENLGSKWSMFLQKLAP